MCAGAGEEVEVPAEEMCWKIKRKDEGANNETTQNGSLACCYAFRLDRL